MENQENKIYLRTAIANLKSLQEETLFLKAIAQANCAHKKRSRTFFTAISQKEAIAEVTCDNCGAFLILSFLRFKATSPTLLSVGKIYSENGKEII